jgi:hypothetical protein
MNAADLGQINGENKIEIDHGKFGFSSGVHVGYG